MTKIIVYPNFAGVDVLQEDNLNETVKNISLLDILPNEKHKDDDYFSSVEMKQYLDKMTKDIDKLDPIILIKNPIEPGKYNVLDGHHRFQLFKKLNKKTIPAMVVDEKIVFLAKDEYGVKNNKAVRMDKVDLNQMNLKNYFNTSESQSTDLNEDCWKGYKRIGGKVKNGKNVPNCVPKNESEGETNEASSPAQQAAIAINMKKKGIEPKKKETKESTDAGSSGSFSGPAFGGGITKREIYKIHNAKLHEEVEMGETTDASSSGSYDVPIFGKTPKGNRNPLKIDGPGSIYKGRAVKDKKFPKYGGPDGVYVKIKEKCKKFPYCNQGNTGALEFIKEDREIKEAINEISKKYGIPRNEVEKIVLNDINQIFI